MANLKIVGVELTITNPSYGIVLHTISVNSRLTYGAGQPPDKDVVRNRLKGATIVLRLTYSDVIAPNGVRDVIIQWSSDTVSKGFTQSFTRDLCDVQFRQRCLLSTSGYASWRLQISKNVPFQWSVTDSGTFSTTPQTKIDVDTPIPNNGTLTLQMKRFGLIAPPRITKQAIAFFQSYSCDVYATISLSVGSELRYWATLEGNVSYQLGNGLRFTARDLKLWQASVYVVSDDTRAVNVGLEGIESGTILSSWNLYVARRFYDGFAVDHQFTLLPELAPIKDSNPPQWAVRLLASDSLDLDSDGPSGNWTWFRFDGDEQYREFPPLRDGSVQTDLSHYIKTRVTSVRIIDPSGSTYVQVSATLRMFRTETGDATEISSLQLKTPSSADSTVWQLSLSGTGWKGGAGASPQVVRAGAFELHLPPGGADPYVLVCAADYGLTGPPSPPNPVMPLVRCFVETLPLFDVVPAGEDDLDRDQYTVLDAGAPTSALKGMTDAGIIRFRKIASEISANMYRENALVFRKPLADYTRTPDGHWSLQYKEENSPSKRRNVTMLLRFTQTSDAITSTESVIVLDRLPFTFAEVHFHPLTETGSTTEVAEWNSLSNSWKMIQIASAPTYLVMSPAVVGEEFVTDKVQTPQGVGGGKSQMALGTPTVITVSPNKDVNYVDVPWNLRRLVTDTTVDVSQFDFEMLYGMACSTDAPHMRLTEAETLYGRLRGELPATFGFNPSQALDDRYLNARLHWSRIYREYQSRLGVFVLSDATMSDRESFSDGSNTICTLRLSDTPSVAGDPITSYLSKSRISSTYPDTGTIFKGGALAGVDNPAIYSQIVGFKQSDKGNTAVIDPRLSVLGGYGTVRAGFGNSKLISSISMGRTITYTVERLGRIGVHWNRAKHVIVYERSVTASRQFFQEQQPLLGYALVRKVEEYVEFLEPERVFAAEDSGSQTSFLKAFKCGDRKRVAVNSAWATTIPNEGLTIPLWNAAAAQRLPDVYPKPQFYLQASTPEPAFDSTDAKPQFLNQDCLLIHPEEIVFYTSTRETSTDTDKWAAVEGVDFVCYPMIIPDATIYDDGNIAAQPLPESPAPPGWEPVTFTIVPPAMGVHSTDGIVTTTKPMGAKVRKVTVSRGSTARPTTVKALLANDASGFQTYQEYALKLASITQSFADVRSLTRNQLAKAAQLPVELKDTVDQVQTKLATLKQSCDTLTTGLPNALSTLSGKLKQPYTDAAAKLESDVSSAQKAVAAGLDALKHNIRILLGLDPVPPGFDYTQPVVVSSNHLLQLIAATKTEAHDWLVPNLEDRLTASIRSWSSALEEQTGAYSPLRPVAVACSDAKVLIIGVQKSLDAVIQGTTSTIVNDCQTAVQQFDALVNTVKLSLTTLQSHARQIDPSMILLALNTSGLSGQLDALEQTAALGTAQLPNVQSAAKTLKNNIDAMANALLSLIALVPETTFDLLQRSTLFQPLYALAHAGDALNLAKKLDALNPQDLMSNLQSICTASVADIAAQTKLSIEKLADKVVLILASQAGGLATQFSALSTQLQQVLALPAADLQKIQSQVGELSRNIQGTVQAATQNFDQYVRQPLMQAWQPLSAPADKLMRTVRALGEPPAVPNLDIKPPTVAYVYDYVNTKVPITPILARAHQIDQALNAMGVSLPAVHLGDELIPPALQKFDLNQILPSFSGLKLDGLFSGIKLPAIGSKDIALTHGWEPQLRRGWLQANVNIPIAKRMVVFQAGVITFCLSDAVFSAQSHVEAVGTHLEQSTKGSISGKWSIEIGESSSLIDFADTALLFDDSGQLHFKFNPAKLKLSDALQAISALIQTFSDPESGFTYGVTSAGVKCAFVLPVPDTAALTSGITGLKFSVFLELDFSAGFVIRLGVGVSSKDRPFNFAVFILGGCGYLQAGVSYDVEKKTFSPTLEMAIGCSAGLAIALGPISGSVYAQFAIELRVANGGYTTGAFFQITGHVSILGIISIDLVFRLEAYYSNGVMTASGHFSIKIKLFMFSISVSRDVSMHLGSHGQARIESPVPPGNQLAALPDASGFSPGLAAAFEAAESYALRYVKTLR